MAALGGTAAPRQPVEKREATDEDKCPICGEPFPCLKH